MSVRLQPCTHDHCKISRREPHPRRLCTGTRVHRLQIICQHICIQIPDPSRPQSTLTSTHRLTRTHISIHTHTNAHTPYQRRARARHGAYARLEPARATNPTTTLVGVDLLPVFMSARKSSISSGVLELSCRQVCHGLRKDNHHKQPETEKRGTHTRTDARNRRQADSTRAEGQEKKKQRLPHAPRGIP